MACEATAGLFRPFLSFPHWNNKHYSISSYIWTPETILGRTQNNETAGCRAVTHHFSLSSVKTQLSGIPPGLFWLCRLLHFGFCEMRILKKSCRKCTHTHRFHTHILHCQSGATRLPQSKNSWMGICTVMCV